MINLNHRSCGGALGDLGDQVHHRNKNGTHHIFIPNNKRREEAFVSNKRDVTVSVSYICVQP